MNNLPEASENMTPTNVPPELADLGNIAISCSGGGYRASAFHLGSLDFLHKVGLLEKVTMLSTVSGGTITGAKYVCSLSQATANGQTDFYEDFYNELYQFILEARLPDQWLERLHPEDTDKPSLIAAAADVYNEKLFDEMRFDQLLNVREQMHLQEIVFNTTELRTGIAFRFRVGRGGSIGNYNIPMAWEFLEEVRIADVVAASSCFPGGFEPIVFPDDFKFVDNWQTLKQKVITKTKEAQARNPQYHDFLAKTLNSLDSFTEEPLPLVDGGIYDNLGIDSLFVADARLQRKGENDKRFNTLIISDTDNIGIATDTDDLNETASLLKISLPIPGNWFNRITIKQIRKGVRWSFVILLISTISFALWGILDLVAVGHISLQSVFLIWTALVFGLITFLFGKVNKFFNNTAKIPEGNDKKSKSSNKFIASLQEIIFDWNVLLKTAGDLSIVDLINMTGLRLLSISSLFLALLKGQRRQSYEFIDALQKTDNLVHKMRQNQGELEELKDHKSLSVINNFILEMAPKSRNFWEKKHQFSLPEYLTPTPEMEQIAIDATQTPTTLWLNENPETAETELDTVVSCGQFTMCFTLLRQIEAMANRPNSKLSPETEAVQQRIKLAWKKFQQNPKMWVGKNREQGLQDWHEYPKE